MTDAQGANRAHRSHRKNYPLVPSQLEPLPTTDGGWQCVLADPPWHYRSWVQVNDTRAARDVERHYRTMLLEEIMAMPVRDVVAPDAHLWLWVTMPFLALGAHVELMKRWGFKPSSSGLVWMKLKRSAGDAQFQLITLAELAKWLHFGMGHTTRKNVEICMLGRRGNAKRLSAKVPEPIISPVREHSRKPDEQYDRIEEYCAGPRLELFARGARDGWTSWGNETEKFA